MRINFSLFATLTLASVAMAQSLTGLWDASVVVNGLTIPFRIEFSGEGSSVTGSFFNGEERVTSTGGRMENGFTDPVRFDHYGRRGWRRLEGWRSSSAVTTT